MKNIKKIRLIAVAGIVVAASVVSGTTLAKGLRNSGLMDYSIQVDYLVSDGNKSFSDTAKCSVTGSDDNKTFKTTATIHKNLAGVKITDIPNVITQLHMSCVVGKDSFGNYYGQDLLINLTDTKIERVNASPLQDNGDQSHCSTDANLDTPENHNHIYISDGSGALEKWHKLSSYKPCLSK